MLRVPSNAIRFDPDLSTMWKEHLEQVHARFSSDVAEPAPGRSLVFEAVIERLLGLGLTVEHTPQASQPNGCAHVSFDRPQGLTKPEKTTLSWNISELLELVLGVVATPRPTGA